MHLLIDEKTVVVYIPLYLLGNLSGYKSLFLILFLYFIVLIELYISPHSPSFLPSPFKHLLFMLVEVGPHFLPFECGYLQ